MQLSICFSKNTSAKGFSQYLHGIIFISSYFYSSSSFSYSYTLSFLIALTAALKSYEAAFQFSPVFSKPFPFPLPSFFSLAFTCLTKVACSLLTSLFASELNYFLLDIKTNLQAFACFSKAFRLNLRPQPSVHSIKSFSPCCIDSYTSSYFIGLSSYTKTAIFFSLGSTAIVGGASSIF